MEIGHKHARFQMTDPAEAPIAGRSRAVRHPRRLRAGFMERDGAFLLVSAVYVGLALLGHLVLGVPARLNLHVSWRLIGIWTLAYGIVGFVAMLGFGTLQRGHSLRHGSTWKQAGAAFFGRRRMAGLFVVLLVLPVFMNSFVAFKMSIPAIHPYAWDVRFMEWDHALHAGRHPWELLQPLLGRATATAFIDSVYYLWFPVVWLTVIWQAWHGDFFSSSRSQFLLAFVLSWILVGTVCATLFSSAGPVYFGRVVGSPDPYGPLMTYLQGVDSETPLTALRVQNLLWLAYADPGAGRVGEGISAMPSMHVSVAVLAALVGFRVHRIVGWLYAGFAVLIFIGSVHLAWHYALDGYVAIVLTIAVWWLAGRIVGPTDRDEIAAGGDDIDARLTRPRG